MQTKVRAKVHEGQIVSSPHRSEEQVAMLTRQVDVKGGRGHSDKLAIG